MYYIVLLSQLKDYINIDIFALYAVALYGIFYVMFTTDLL